ncbi:uncharacterized protein G6M90_00g017820 [Metarhizium brunneum]|uniref:Uncharacterized protein n=1 Tax=Metarhizium brunneum TaxID=500148 RepID=A0A7D5UPE6_9HYPO
MFQHVSIRHIPALYFAFANCVGLVMDPLSGPCSLIELYGLPPAIADVPETWPVWRAGQGRIILLGLLMHVFYWRRQYAVCDVLLVGTAFLGINDCMVVWHNGDKTWAWIRLFGSFAFGAAGFFGLTQGPGAKNKIS